MKTVTIRDFLRSPKSFLPPPSEGLMVTRRDGDSFYIYPNVRQDVRQPVASMSDITPKMSDNMGTMPVENKGENIGWCELHFEKGKEYPRKLITWEDENGTPVVIKKFACPKCVEKYESMGRGRVFYL